MTRIVRYTSRRKINEIMNHVSQEIIFKKVFHNQSHQIRADTQTLTSRIILISDEFFIEWIVFLLQTLLCHESVRTKIFRSDVEKQIKTIKLKILLSFEFYFNFRLATHNCIIIEVKLYHSDGNEALPRR